MKYVRTLHIPYSVHANSYKHFAKLFFFRWIHHFNNTFHWTSWCSFFAFWLLNFPFFAGEFYRIFGQFADPAGWWFPDPFYVDEIPDFFVGFMDVNGC